MLTKKWNIPEIKNRAHEYECLKSKGLLPFIKKVLRVRKNISGRSRESLDAGLRLFNKIFETNYIFEWEQTGQADIHNVVNIKEKNGQMLIF